MPDGVIEPEKEESPDLILVPRSRLPIQLRLMPDVVKSGMVEAARNRAARKDVFAPLINLVLIELLHSCQAKVDQNESSLDGNVSRNGILLW